METYEVGPSNLPQFELDYIPIDNLWVVYWYVDNGYDGDGFLATMKPDGHIETKGLCNALDDDDAEQSVVRKVKELLGLN